jgi:hypothetical protein
VVIARKYYRTSNPIDPFARYWTCDGLHPMSSKPLAFFRTQGDKAAPRFLPSRNIDNKKKQSIQG